MRQHLAFRRTVHWSAQPARLVLQRYMRTIALARGELPTGATVQANCEGGRWAAHEMLREPHTDRGEDRNPGVVTEVVVKVDPKSGG